MNIVIWETLKYTDAYGIQWEVEGSNWDQNAASSFVVKGEKEVPGLLFHKYQMKTWGPEENQNLGHLSENV